MEMENLKYDMELDDVVRGSDEQEEGVERIPPKVIICISLLSVLGIVLVLGGIHEFEIDDLRHGTSLLILGILCAIPGFYFTYKLIQARFWGTPYDRMLILN